MPPSPAIMRSAMNTTIALRALVFGALIAAATVAPALPEAIASAPPPAVQADGWTGTWGASPQSSGTTFNQKTLRQIVHTGISGTSSRIQISNVFGNTPLNVQDVHIAQRTSGSSINTGTDRAVTFGGSSSTVVAVGATAISDAVAFTVAANSDVAVSMFLPNN